MEIKPWIKKRQDSLRGKNWPKLKKLVLDRDNYTCQYCGRKGYYGYTNQDDNLVELNIDHIIPTSKGGETSLTNLKTSCFKCNQNKKHKHIQEWKITTHCVTTIRHISDKFDVSEKVKSSTST